MKAAIPKEIAPGETRVAATPETVRRLAKLGLEVMVQAGAGAASSFQDDQYRQAGAAIVPDAAALLGEADLVLKVRPPLPAEGGGRHEVELLKAGAALVSLLQPLANLETVDKLAAAKVTSFALDLMPRISRAQTMDVLSSMGTVAGYKAVLLGADALAKMMPLLMTAAGTVQPAEALIIGAGVAGLSAVATARRLGAVVKAVDTRPAVKEQVESLGARFVPLTVHHEEPAEAAGGYARDLGEEFYRQEQEVLAPHVQNAHLVVTTALIPNRRAPLLITEAMVKSMRPGSVIVDLAAEAGGNCALTKPGQRVTAHGVTIIGPLNLAAEIPIDASQMFSRNVATFAAELVHDGQVRVDLENQVLRDTLVTHEGRVTNETVQQALARRGEAPK